jgi:hypothetical protein
MNREAIAAASRAPKALLNLTEPPFDDPDVENDNTARTQAGL